MGIRKVNGRYKNVVPRPKFGTGTKLETVHTVNGEGHRNDQLLQRSKKS